ncbi:MAG: CxxC-x17-CxxC domain-containing protein [Nanoarchaeota archaeon]
MRDFNSDRRSGGFRRDGGRSSGGFGGRSGGFRRGGDRGGFERRGPVEMHDATCSKCGNPCKIPFRPTGERPVFCSACFEDKGSGRSMRRDSLPGLSNNNGSNMSSEQFEKINSKLDKILKVLSDLELDSDEDLDVDLADESESESQESRTE